MDNDDVSTKSIVILIIDFEIFAHLLSHPLPGEMNISQLQGKIEFNTFLF